MYKAIPTIGKLIVLVIFVFVITGCTTIKNEPQEDEKTEKIPETAEYNKEIPYKIIEKEDISYTACKRVGIKIVVPDDSNKTDVEFVMKKIIDNNKLKWADITVWAYKYSEENQTDGIYTMGIQEYSICE